VTKPRPPLTFAQAVTRIAGLIGWTDAATIVGRKERTVRLWSEPDQGGTCTLDQARDLDAAYRAAGGDGAPLLDAYAFQLEVQIALQTGCRRALASDLEAFTRESGDAVASVIPCLDGSASAAQHYRALAEVDECSGKLAKLRRRLTSLLSGTLPAGAHPRPQR
jgi:hypothetical protein